MRYLTVYWHFYWQHKWLFLGSLVAAISLAGFPTKADALFFLMPFSVMRLLIYALVWFVLKNEKGRSFFYQNLGISIVKLLGVVFGFDFMICYANLFIMSLL